MLVSGVAEKDPRLFRRAEHRRRFSLAVEFNQCPNPAFRRTRHRSLIIVARGLLYAWRSSVQSQFLPSACVDYARPCSTEGEVIRSKYVAALWARGPQCRPY